MAAAVCVWLRLIAGYVWHAVRAPSATLHEYDHPVAGAAPALIGISTMLVGIAVLPYTRGVSAGLVAAGLAWQLTFALWHTGASLARGRIENETAPNIYLPTVAGNFVSAGALGAIGLPDWGWLFLGAGLFSWLALESIVLRALWAPGQVPVERRALIGIHFAPPAVMGMAWLLIEPGSHNELLLLIWGYAVFQVLLALRLFRWLREQPIDLTYWSHSFGLGSTAVMTMKFALAGFGSAFILAPLMFVLANVFVLGLGSFWCARIMRA
jgi:tellurite resistance protein